MNNPVGEYNINSILKQINKIKGEQIELRENRYRELSQTVNKLYNGKTNCQAKKGCIWE